MRFLKLMWLEQRVLCFKKVYFVWIFIWVSNNNIQYFALISHQLVQSMFRYKIFYLYHLQVGRKRHDWNCIHRLWKDTGVFSTYRHVCFGAGKETPICEKGRALWPHHLSFCKSIGLAHCHSCYLFSFFCLVHLSTSFHQNSVLE